MGGFRCLSEWSGDPFQYCLNEILVARRDQGKGDLLKHAKEISATISEKHNVNIGYGHFVSWTGRNRISGGGWYIPPKEFLPTIAECLNYDLNELVAAWEKSKLKETPIRDGKKQHTIYRKDEK